MHSGDSHSQQGSGGGVLPLRCDTTLLARWSVLREVIEGASKKIIVSRNATLLLLLATTATAIFTAVVTSSAATTATVTVTVTTAA
jgi:hypothetical protein